MITVQELMRASGVAFGTSGARGMVTAMTDAVCFGYTIGFLSYLAERGEIEPGCAVALAGDLRPSTPRILVACIEAIRAFGSEPVFCGYVPTPALALHAFAHGIPSLMVTGSHIPADRNGIKFYRPTGELLKSDEPGMGAQLVDLGGGRFVDGYLAVPSALPDVTDVEAAYVRRYVDHFGQGALKGRRIGVYQHSAVGRDILARVLRELGAEIALLGRSETFVPVDTEAIRPEDVALAHEWAADGTFDAIVSTDGDSDRPLLADESGNWLRGDILGILCAERVGATSVVTPVSSNTALELHGRFANCRRTRIGSPYVIAAMTEEQAAGSSVVCGYEANGGFLLGTAIPGADGTITAALPTRDAVLPILAVLTADAPTVSAQVGALPHRFTFSDRISPFPAETSRRFFDRLLAGGPDDQLALQTSLFGDFAGSAQSIDLVDGVRTTFSSGVIIHVRGSGNAPELRCYTEAASPDAAAACNQQAFESIRRFMASEPDPA
jgi:phosphomannomutase